MSRSLERLHCGTLLCCVPEKMPFEKNFVDKMGGREYHGFLSKLFFPSAPNKCVAEPFSVSMILCSEEL